MTHSEIKKILIIDDQDTLTWSLSKGLFKEDPSFSVLRASDGNEALGILREHEADFPLVISDLQMPGMGGLELLQIIREEFPATRVIIMTSDGSQELRNYVHQLGSWYIEKPFSLEHIRGLVDEALSS